MIVVQSETGNITEEISLAKRIFYSSKTSMKLILLTPNALDPYVFPKLPFDAIRIFGVHTGNISKNSMNYYAISDKRWRILKAAFTMWYPELFRRKDGTFTGTGHDIWSILGRKINLKIVYAVFFKAVLGASGVLGKKEVDLVIPHGFLSESMSKVGCSFISFITYQLDFKYI